MIETLTFGEVARKIGGLPGKHRQKIVAIDGGGGAGKTTFAERLQKEIPDSFIVEIDDFYKPPQLRVPVAPGEIINPNMDWDRFVALVLEAAASNREISYQLYDKDAGTLSGEVKRAPPTATIILEGVWSLRQEFLDFYDYRIWLEAEPEVRLERGLSRDGEAMRQVWEQEWIPIDEHYRETQKPHLKADLVVDSTHSDLQNNKIVLL